MRGWLGTLMAGLMALTPVACGLGDHPHDADGAHHHEEAAGHEHDEAAGHDHGEAAGHEHDEAAGHDDGKATAHDHDDAGGHGDGAAAGRPTVVVTHWTGRTELFMEYPALVAGQTSRFAVHVTDLEGFKPMTGGEAVVVLRSRDGDETRSRGDLSRPGIYGVDVTPREAGSFRMTLRVDSPGLQDSHDLGEVTVHSAGSSFPGEADGDGEEVISFLKEQQWKLDFGTEVVEARSLQGSLEVPATIRPRAGGEVRIAAPAPGRIDPALAVPVPGDRVRKGRVLARVLPRTGEMLDAAGLRADLVEARQKHQLALQERDRAERLVEARALPARRLHEAEAALAAAGARLEAATGRMEQLEAVSQSGEQFGGDGWFNLRAPFDGVISDVRFAPGAGVSEGEPLLGLVDTARVRVAGAVPESKASLLPEAGAAELILGNEAPVPLGRPESMGGIVDPVARTVEVRYGLDNGSRRVAMGQGVRLRIFLGRPETRPAVPESAVVDDGGRPVVYVQSGGESFQRRPVRLGHRRGGYVHALEGVEPGERVVTRGAYLVRLASLSTQAPSHGHVH